MKVKNLLNNKNTREIINLYLSNILDNFYNLINNNIKLNENYDSEKYYIYDDNIVKYYYLKDAIPKIISIYNNIKKIIDSSKDNFNITPLEPYYTLKKTLDDYDTIIQQGGKKKTYNYKITSKKVYILNNKKKIIGTVMGDISSDPGDTVEEILKSINRKQ
jgi:hypothetical protein